MAMKGLNHLVFRDRSNLRRGIEPVVQCRVLVRNHSGKSLSCGKEFFIRWTSLQLFFPACVYEGMRVFVLPLRNPRFANHTFSRLFRWGDTPTSLSNEAFVMTRLAIDIIH